MCSAPFQRFERLDKNTVFSSAAARVSLAEGMNEKCEKNNLSVGLTPESLDRRLSGNNSVLCLRLGHLVVRIVVTLMAQNLQFHKHVGELAQRRWKLLKPEKGAQFGVQRRLRQLQATLACFAMVNRTIQQAPCLQVGLSRKGIGNFPRKAVEDGVVSGGGGATERRLPGSAGTARVGLRARKFKQMVRIQASSPRARACPAQKKPEHRESAPRLFPWKARF